MSGIAGSIELDGKPVLATWLRRMLGHLRRRGPDRQAVYCDRNAGFAHALLATTPEGLVEPQPWVNAINGCVVVSDSRLDDRHRVLRELGITRPADDVGDGELLHAAWQRWGTGCADRLRGDFAFVVWNPHQQTVYAARDPMGVRPLVFHFLRGRRFVFGSSAEAVLAQGDVPAGIDEGRIADALFVETEGIDQVSTFYQAVHKLPPAHWLLIKAAGDMESQRYWQPVGDRPESLPRTTGEWVEAQREQLDRAVRRRLRSHRPVGSMLSGGLDSSSVVALASGACAAQGRPPLPVFSATQAADPYCTETASIHAVLSRRHCQATLVDLAQMGNQEPDGWADCGEPFDGSMTLVAQIYRAASAQGVVCLLDGVPADNLFATGRQAGRLFDQRRFGDAWRAAITQWTMPGVRYPRWHALRVMAGCLAPRLIHDLRDEWSDAAEYRALRRTSLASTGLIARVEMRERFRRYRLSVRNSHQWHPTEEALSSMAAPYITAGIERYNRVASRFGIEPRPPFTDRDLITFQAWVPISLRLRDGHPKWILRQAMRSLLPDQVVWRTDKSHIGWAFNREHMANYLTRAGAADLGANDTVWIDARRLQSAWRQSGSASNPALAAALQLLEWHRSDSAHAPGSIDSATALP